MAPETGDLSPMGRLFAVADGMGGHRGGKMASRCACDALAAYYSAQGHKLNGRPADLCRYLADMVYRIDRSLRLRAIKNPALEDMGTTLTCLVLTPHTIIIAHVGDSRIYRLRRGRLSCLTEDHTFVGEMIFEGVLTPAKARTHPMRHVLTQAVGTGEPLDMVYSRIDRLQRGDRFLLCTDGLHAAVASDRITAQLRRNATAIAIAAGLVADALAQGTRDNVTAIVVIGV